MTNVRPLRDPRTLSDDAIRLERFDPRTRPDRVRALRIESNRRRASQRDCSDVLLEPDSDQFLCYDEGSPDGNDAVADPDGTLRRMLATKSVEKASRETRRILAKRLASLEVAPNRLKAPEVPRVVVRMVGYRVRSAPAHAARLRFLYAERRLRWIAHSSVESVVGVTLDGLLPAERSSARIDRSGDEAAFRVAERSSARIDRSGDEAAFRVAERLRRFLGDMPEAAVGELGEHVIETFAFPETGTERTEWTALAVHGATMGASDLVGVRAHVEDAMVRGVAFHQDTARRAPLHRFGGRGHFTFGATSAVQGAGSAADVASAFERSEEGHGDALALLHPELRAVVEAAGRPEGRLILGESFADPQGLANRTRKLEVRTDG